MTEILSITTPSHLSVKAGKLHYHSNEDGQQRCCPMDELDVLILDHPQLSYTQPLMHALGKEKVMIVHCDQRHFPHLLTLPLTGHHLQRERIGAQLACNQKEQEQLWQQVIQAKIL